MNTAVPAWANAENWTNRQMVEACLHNAEQAAQEERQLRVLYDSLPPGDPRLVGDGTHPPLGLQVQKAASNQRHWRRELAYWRARCVEEGDDALPPTTWKPPQRKKRTDWTTDPKFDADPIVRAERDQRQQATQQQELEQLARQAAAEGRGDQVEEEELAF